MLLNYLAPETNNQTFTVPVSTDISERIEKNGVLDHDIIAAQTKAALDTLRIANPYKVATLGGEYKGDVTIVWIDAHPNITLPGDDYNGSHSMALTACMGMGDRETVGQLPTSVQPEAVCLAGLRECEYPYIEKRVEELGLAHYFHSKLPE